MVGKNDMLWPGTLYRDGLKTILKNISRGKVRFHAFRRFRQSVLEKSEARQLLIDFWLGHKNLDMSSRYAKQLTEDMEFRQEWAEKVGLGFDLSEVFDGGRDLLALRALQTQSDTVAA
jgi:integrase